MAEPTTPQDQGHAVVRDPQIGIAIRFVQAWPKDELLERDEPLVRIIADELAQRIKAQL
jgi:hypothetical protein